MNKNLILNGPLQSAVLQALGGAKYMFLTHRDDVADHARWAKELGLQRIIHSTEANRSQGTKYALPAPNSQEENSKPLGLLEAFCNAGSSHISPSHHY